MNMGKDPSITWTSTSYIYNSNFDSRPGSYWGRQVKVQDPSGTPLIADQCLRFDNDTYIVPSHRSGYVIHYIDGSSILKKMDTISLQRVIKWTDSDALYNNAWNREFKR
jgi:hypothetical protein